MFSADTLLCTINHTLTFLNVYCSDTVWNQDLRNGNLTGSVNCSPREGHFLFFSDNTIMQNGSGRTTIASRLVTTAPLKLRDMSEDVTYSLASPNQTPPIYDSGTEATTSFPDNLSTIIQQWRDRVLAMVGGQLNCK